MDANAAPLMHLKIDVAQLTQLTSLVERPHPDGHLHFVVRRHLCSPALASFNSDSPRDATYSPSSLHFARSRACLTSFATLVRSLVHSFAQMPLDIDSQTSNPFPASSYSSSSS